MTIVSDLVTLGVLSLDDTRPDGVIIHVPIKTTATAIENNGFTLFALASGWTPTIEVPDLVTNGDWQANPTLPVTMTTAENPIKDYEAAIADVQDYVGKKFDAVIGAESDKIAAVAKAQAEAQMKAAFGRA